MSAPRLEVRLDRVEANTRVLVARLALRGIRVTAVTKAAAGWPELARAFLDGGATGLADSRVENLERLGAAQVPAQRTLLRSPMLSQARAVVTAADRSLNCEPVLLDALAEAAVALGRVHEVIVMVELGDLREGVAATDAVALASSVHDRPGLELAGLGTNLACQCGVVPDQSKMDQLSDLVGQVEARLGHRLPIVSGGNSANLEWALSTDDVGRVDELRLGEALLLGTEPLHRRPIVGLHTDAFSLVGEVIEVQDKPAQPWGEIGQAAYGTTTRPGTGTVRQALVAIGRQDTDPEGLAAPEGTRILGASGDHLVLDVGDQATSVGEELRFGLGYGALVRAMTSPYIARVSV